jgi:hypothetical protein
MSGPVLVSGSHGDRGARRGRQGAGSGVTGIRTGRPADATAVARKRAEGAA